MLLGWSLPMLWAHARYCALQKSVRAGDKVELRVSASPARVGQAFEDEAVAEPNHGAPPPNDAAHTRTA